MPPQTLLPLIANNALHAACHAFSNPPPLLSFKYVRRAHACAPARPLQVRIAAAGKVSLFSKMLTAPLIVASIVPCVKDLSNDSRWVGRRRGRC